jgi:hypothetical protein
VHAALPVLSASQREALDLFLRHELDPADLAEVLGVTPHEASIRVAQARNGCIGVPSASVTFNANVTATVTFSC